MPSQVSLEDADWMTPLATKAARAAAKWWPHRIPTEWGVEQMRATVDVALRPTPGHRIYTDPERRGFFICRPGRLEETGCIGSELVIWFVERGLPPDEYREVLHGLFTDWLRDEVARGEYEWAHGVMPVSMPVGDRKYLDDWGIGVTEYEEHGATWRRYYGRIKEIVERLPK